MNKIQPPGDLTLVDHLLDHKRLALVITLFFLLIVLVSMYLWVLLETKAPPEQIPISALGSGVKLAIIHPPSVTIGSSSVISVSLDAGGAITAALPITITLTELHADEVLITGPRVITATIQPDNKPPNKDRRFEFRVLSDAKPKGFVELSVVVEIPREKPQDVPVEITIRKHLWNLIMTTGIGLLVLGALVAMFWDRLTRSVVLLFSNQSANQPPKTG